MGQRFAVLASALALAISVRSVQAAQSKAEMSTQSVLRFFDGHRGETIDAFLMRCRPSPLDAVSVPRVRESLPEDMNVVRSSKKMGEKIAAAQRVLEYSGRSGVITIAVIDSDDAYAALYFRAILLVSTRVLDILSAEELAAVAAHEVGHDYEWTEYWTAIQQHDNTRARELELRSDGIAVLTLKALGITPERLVSAVIKVTRCNEWQVGVHDAETSPEGDRGTHDRYVPLKERIAFIRAMAQLEWADPRASTSAPGVKPPK